MLLELEIPGRSCSALVVQRDEDSLRRVFVQPAVEAEPYVFHGRRRGQKGLTF
jgi:hypothetical protein